MKARRRSTSVSTPYHTHNYDFPENTVFSKMLVPGMVEDAVSPACRLLPEAFNWPTAAKHVPIPGLDLQKASTVQLVLPFANHRRRDHNPFKM